MLNSKQSHGQTPYLATSLRSQNRILKVKNKLKAMLVGGPQNGQTLEFDEPHPEIAIAARVMERNGNWRVVFTSKYKLVSSASPLQYEFETAN